MIYAKGVTPMQIVNRTTSQILAPRVYRNRPSPITLLPDPKECPLGGIYIVDADRNTREEISNHIASFGNPIIEAASAFEYSNMSGNGDAACVILNLALPDLPGLELQKRIKQNGDTPVIFFSDKTDISGVVSAMKAGAIEFLTKPIERNALISAVHTALERNERGRQRKAESVVLQERLKSLTPREREVLVLIISGFLNKQAASALGISEVTLQIHRSQVMRKMQAESLAVLVRMAVKLRIPCTQ
jgi:FixJ family two-component response regulator